MSVGRMNVFWEALSYATRVAQQIGLHLDTMTCASSVDELEKEMRRRTFCNLYVWDRYVVWIILSLETSLFGDVSTKNEQLSIKTSRAYTILV